MSNPAEMQNEWPTDKYPDVTIIDDSLLVSNKVKHDYGHQFNCPQCEIPALLHFHKYCPSCGLGPLEIQSITVRDYLTAMNNQRA